MIWRNTFTAACNYLQVAVPGCNFVVFDTETTGLDGSAKVIEFAAIRAEITSDGKCHVISEIDQMINPGAPLPEKIIEITGITDEELSPYKGEEEYLPLIRDIFAGADFIVAHNVAFDVRMLRQMEARTGASILPDGAAELDTLQMVRDFIPRSELESRRLSSVVSYLFPEKEYKFHRAIDDTRACANVFWCFLRKYQEASRHVPAPKRRAHLEWASYWENPKQGSMRRIKLCLDPTGESHGDIYWDCAENAWSHKADKKSEKLFTEIDLADLERQVLARYGYRYGATNMEDLSRNWERAKRDSAKKDPAT